MADFSGRIVSAQYANSERTIIKVLYEEDEKLFPYSFPIDENNPDYQDLLAEGWDHEKIADHTVERLKGESQAFNEQINQAAQALAREMLGLDKMQKEKIDLEKKIINLDKNEKDKLKTLQSDLYNHVLANNEDKDELFKCKLWALELDAISKAEKEIKTSIRKSQKILDILRIVEELS